MFLLLVAVHLAAAEVVLWEAANGLPELPTSANAQATLEQVEGGPAAAIVLTGTGWSGLHFVLAKWNPAAKLPSPTAHQTLVLRVMAMDRPQSDRFTVSVRGFDVVKEALLWAPIPAKVGTWTDVRIPLATLAKDGEVAKLGRDIQALFFAVHSGPIEKSAGLYVARIAVE
jgi:hypothetical protein